MEIPMKKELQATTRFVDRPGGRVAYEVSGDGPLVIAVPGMGDLRSVYREVTPALVDAGYRVASMDLRGHGDSDASFGSYGTAETGADMLALAQELGGAPAVVMGNSMAAGAAVWAAAESPDLVDGLVLIGPFVRDAAVGRAAELAFRLALLRPWGRRAWLSWYARLYPGRKPADLDSHRAQIGDSLSDVAHWQAFVQTTHTSHAPATARLGNVDARSLVVMGDHDPDFKDPAAEADFIAEQLGGSVLMVPGSGHYPQAEYPEVVMPALLRFLAEGSPVAAPEVRNEGTRAA
jgi:pimeloyl-ACP methyl ester carboxylesterase